MNTKQSKQIKLTSDYELGNCIGCGRDSGLSDFCNRCTPHEMDTQIEVIEEAFKYGGIKVYRKS